MAKEVKKFYGYEYAIRLATMIELEAARNESWSRENARIAFRP